MSALNTLLPLQRLWQYVDGGWVPPPGTVEGTVRVSYTARCPSCHQECEWVGLGREYGTDELVVNCRVCV